MPVTQALMLAVVIAVIFVNGWTDAPNAIASAVASGAMEYRAAVRLAAVCNLLGIAVMSLVSASVADTVISLAKFDTSAPREAAAGLCAAMLAIVVFAVAAWAFGIPTSESHALIAALSGASLALGGGLDPHAWGKVLLGLAMSMGMGLALGALLTAALAPRLERCSTGALSAFQTVAAGGMAFMHGAQDGQKFIAVLVVADMLAKGELHSGTVDIREHWLALCLTAAVMALGTSVGGGRIIRTVGERMVTLRKGQGVCADLAGAVCLLAASLSGIPMSTTHTKTTAIMGAGLSGGKADVSVMRGMLIAWIVTFPVCGALGYVLTLLFNCQLPLSLNP